MSSKIALIICIVFILYLFRIEYQRKQDVSNAIWVPLLWFMIISSRSVGSWFTSFSLESELASYSSGSPIDRNIFILLMLSSLFILSKRDKSYILQILKSNSWLIIFFIYCSLSVMWSDIPIICLKRLFRASGVFLVILVVLTENNPIEAIKTMIRRLAYVLIPFSILLIKYYRDLGTRYGEFGGTVYVGVCDNKNNLGRVILVCGFYFFLEFVSLLRNKNMSIDKRHLFVNIIFLIMIWYLFIMANSVTALVCLATGILTYTLIGIPVVKKNIKNIAFIFLLICSIFVVIQITFNITQGIILGMGRDLTFTGRIGLWQDLLAFNTNRLVGVGYDSFFTTDRLNILWDKYWWRPNQAHNGYLDVYLELGILGLVLWAGIVIKTFKNINRTLLVDYETGRIQMSFLFMFLLFNITEASLKIRTMMFFVFLLTTLYCPYKFQINHSKKHFFEK